MKSPTCQGSGSGALEKTGETAFGESVKTTENRLPTPQTLDEWFAQAEEWLTVNCSNKNDHAQRYAQFREEAKKLDAFGLLSTGWAERINNEAWSAFGNLDPLSRIGVVALVNAHLAIHGGSIKEAHSIWIENPENLAHGPTTVTSNRGGLRLDFLGPNGIDLYKISQETLTVEAKSIAEWMAFQASPVVRYIAYGGYVSSGRFICFGDQYGGGFSYEVGRKEFLEKVGIANDTEHQELYRELGRDEYGHSHILSMSELAKIASATGKIIVTGDLSDFGRHDVSAHTPNCPETKVQWDEVVVALPDGEVKMLTTGDPKHPYEYFELETLFRLTSYREDVENLILRLADVATGRIEDPPPYIMHLLGLVDRWGSWYRERIFHELGNDGLQKLTVEIARRAEYVGFNEIDGRNQEFSLPHAPHDMSIWEYCRLKGIKPDEYLMSTHILLEDLPPYLDEYPEFERYLKALARYRETILGRIENEDPESIKQTVTSTSDGRKIEITYANMHGALDFYDIEARACERDQGLHGHLGELHSILGGYDPKMSTHTSFRVAMAELIRHTNGLPSPDLYKLLEDIQSGKRIEMERILKILDDKSKRGNIGSVIRGELGNLERLRRFARIAEEAGITIYGHASKEEFPNQLINWEQNCHRWSPDGSVYQNRMRDGKLVEEALLLPTQERA